MRQKVVVLLEWKDYIYILSFFMGDENTLKIDHCD